MTLQPKHVALTVILMLLSVVAVITQSFAYYTNGAFGFPLDDPWIHLQFARNLHDLGSFSYFKNEVVTSGSTAPLYTLILGLGFFFTGNEMILSYVLGVVSFAGAAAFFFLLADRWVNGRSSGLIPGIAATLLFVLEPRLQWIALSGMETTLFILLLLAVVYFFLEERPAPLGIAAGLLIWIRPEAIILFGVLAAYVVYHRRVVKEKREKKKKAGTSSIAWLRPALLITALFGVGYIAFNYTLSGSILPNTYAAKLKYYSSGTRDFPGQVFRFLTGGHFLVISPFIGLGILATIFQVVKRRPAPHLLSLLFSLALFLAYWWKLPYLYQNGRYLMPILPFVIFLAIAGLDVALSFVNKHFSLLAETRRVVTVRNLLYLVFVIQFGVGVWENRIFYQDSCKYINDRQVRAGKWIRDRLPGDAIVATHDIGAIAYYSGRRIVDMVGLVSPEMIGNIGDLSKLKAFLVSQRVTHLALLRNWFEAVNVNPIFHTDEQTPEIMEIFQFDPRTVHLTSSEVNWLTDRGWQFLSRGNVQQGGPLVEQAVRMDPMSSRAHHHLGWAFMMIGKLDDAEKEFRTAINLHPTYWNAHFALTQVPLKRGQQKEAVKRLEELLRLNPNMIAAYQVLAEIAAATGDSAKASRYLEEFTRRQKALL